MGATVRTQKARGAEILLEILRSEGIKFIFGNPGTTELPLIDALVVNPDFRYVWGLQEATAVGMADGYAQASGKPAFVNLHTSGGLGHGMGAIMNAKIARAPMVVTAGSTGSQAYSCRSVARCRSRGNGQPRSQMVFRTEFVR